MKLRRESGPCLGWTMKADNVVSGSIADTRVFELRPVRDLINKETILHANESQEAYHEHAFEACA